MNSGALLKYVCRRRVVVTCRASSTFNRMSFIKVVLNNCRSHVNKKSDLQNTFTLIKSTAIDPDDNVWCDCNTVLSLWPCELNSFAQFSLINIKGMLRNVVFFPCIRGLSKQRCEINNIQLSERVFFSDSLRSVGWIVRIERKKIELRNKSHLRETITAVTFHLFADRFFSLNHPKLGLLAVISFIFTVYKVSVFFAIKIWSEMKFFVRLSPYLKTKSLCFTHPDLCADGYVNQLSSLVIRVIPNFVRDMLQKHSQKKDSFFGNLIKQMATCTISYSFFLLKLIELNFWKKFNDYIVKNYHLRTCTG